MLSDLPFELLSQITSYLPTARSLLHLSLTCQRLYKYVEKEGYRVFVQSRFPSQPTPPFWKDAVHALTTLSRNWDRKSLLAHLLTPSGSMTRLPNYPAQTNAHWRQRRQTMGFKPIIDSYDEWTGNSWTAKREVLAWAGGAELVIRLKTMGKAAEEQWRVANKNERANFNQHHHHLEWIVYREQRHAEGIDDITSLNVLRPSQRDLSGTSAKMEEIVIGRASGGLEMLKISPDSQQNVVNKKYVTGNCPVRSADISPSSSMLLAACLSDTILCVYPLKDHSPMIEPMAEVTIIPDGRYGRSWSSRFISPDRVAIGLGPSTKPIHVYQTAPAGVMEEPIRKFSAAEMKASMLGENRVDTGLQPTESPTSGTSSVYSLAVIPTSSSAGGNEGDLLLSGWYDGGVRLHDMRSPSAHVQSYQDSVDPFSAVYSLVVLGRERFVVGGARHSIMKVFDLRMTGGKAYYHTDSYSCNSDSSQSPATRHSQTCGPCRRGRHYEPQHQRRDWNVFLSPRWPTFSRINTRRSAESPVYSLSSPSAISTALYAGLENNIVQLDIVSMMDAHPDPVFKYGPKKTGNREHDIRTRWNPQGNVMRLAMYEQVPMGAMMLRVQSDVGHVDCGVREWDERWCEAR